MPPLTFHDFLPIFLRSLISSLVSVFPIRRPFLQPSRPLIALFQPWISTGPIRCPARSSMQMICMILLQLSSGRFFFLKLILSIATQSFPTYACNLRPRDADQRPLAAWTLRSLITTTTTMLSTSLRMHFRLRPRSSLGGQILR